MIDFYDQIKFILWRKLKIKNQGCNSNKKKKCFTKKCALKRLFGIEKRNKVHLTRQRKSKFVLQNQVIDESKTQFLDKLCVDGFDHVLFFDGNFKNGLICCF